MKPYYLLILIVFILVIMKLLGCRSIRFIRYFSDVQKVTKFKPKASRKINYCTPILSEERKKVKPTSYIIFFMDIQLIRVKQFLVN